MRKIAIADYKIKARDQETGNSIEAPYNVKESLISILFLPALQLQAVELLERDRLGSKIMDVKDGFVLLEEAEYKKVLDAVNLHKGFGKNDVEFVRRVLEAEEVDVKEDKAPAKSNKGK